jgi:hypothetical protein
VGRIDDVQEEDRRQTPLGSATSHAAEYGPRPSEKTMRYTVSSRDAGGTDLCPQAGHLP